MDLLMGLLAALCWGGVDFLLGHNARGVGARRAVLFTQGSGLVVVSMLFSIYTPTRAEFEAISLWQWGYGVAAGTIALCALLAVNRAFAAGMPGEIAPIVVSYGAVTALLSWLSGEAMSLWQGVGLAVCVIGVVLTAGSPAADAAKRSGMPLGRRYAVLAAVLFGIGYWLQGRYAIPALGPLWVIWLGFLVAVVVLICIGLLPAHRARVLTPPPVKFRGSMLAVSGLNLAGLGCFCWGVSQGSTALVSVLSSFSAGITAMLGYVFLKERLSLRQWLGGTLVILGAAFIHVYG